jgi:hypothetical protein
MIEALVGIEMELGETAGLRTQNEEWSGKFLRCWVWAYRPWIHGHWDGQVKVEGQGHVVIKEVG